MDTTDIELEIDPPQAEPVVEALRAVLASADRPPDPWWRAGLDEALDA
jgi:hypothetical protein